MNEINTGTTEPADTRFVLQEFYYPYDKINDESDFDDPVYLEPIIYFNDLTQYHDIVKKHFSKSQNFLELTEYYHVPDLIDETNYFNECKFILEDSQGCLKNVDLEKLNNTIESLENVIDQRNI